MDVSKLWWFRLLKRWTVKHVSKDSWELANRRVRFVCAFKQHIFSPLEIIPSYIALHTLSVQQQSATNIFEAFRHLRNAYRVCCILKTYILYLMINIFVCLTYRCGVLFAPSPSPVRSAGYPVQTCDVHLWFDFARAPESFPSCAGKIIQSLYFCAGAV